MVKYQINGIDKNMGAIRTGHAFLMSKFDQPRISFRITKRGRRPVVKTIVVKTVIGKALKYIDRNCASKKRCNDYFLTLGKHQPITLRKILDEKTLHIYRLKATGTGASSTTLPAGFCMSWGKSWAQIGLNEIVLEDHLTAASVLLHELAHVAGAPGRRQAPKSLAAEKSLIHCGMKKLYDPNAVGAVETEPGPAGAGSRLA